MVRGVVFASAGPSPMKSTGGLRGRYRKALELPDTVTMERETGI
ncbi:MAG: hypothetical protein V1724_04020 [Chloroflexota bacterium]